VFVTKKRDCTGSGVLTAKPVALFDENAAALRRRNDTGRFKACRHPTNAHRSYCEADAWILCTRISETVADRSAE
jgi:hypothetical protein